MFALPCPTCDTWHGDMSTHTDSPCDTAGHRDQQMMVMEDVRQGIKREECV